MRPSKEEMMMRMAEVAATRSTCARARVGCVVARPDLTSIVSMGYNGNARGLKNTCDSTKAGACGCLHAEENALIKAPYDQGDLVMFCTTMPCPDCAKRILNSRVRWVYYRSAYRLTNGLTLLNTGGVETYQI